MMSDFFEIEKRTVKSEGHEIVVLPFKVSQIAKAAKAIKPIASLMSSGKFQVLDILDNIDVVIEVVSIATGKPAEEVGELTLDTMFEIVVSIFEVNQDFFVKAVMPKVVEMLAETAKAKSQMKQ